MIRMEFKTEVLSAAEEKSIKKAAALLQKGELVALPTETVYGIAADARNGEAVKKIFVAKGRPQDNPLIVHVTGPEMLPGLVSEVPERAQREVYYAGKEELLMNIKRKSLTQTRPPIAPKADDYMSSYGDK